MPSDPGLAWRPSRRQCPSVAGDLRNMTTVHIISSFFPPQNGGLQQWTKAFATAVGEAGLRTIVYICEHPTVAHLHSSAPFEMVDIAPMVDLWTAPLRASEIEAQALARDRSRTLVACLKAELAKRLSPDPQIILSNFITTAGFSAHLVAQELQLPHLAIVAGTDFTRGLRNSGERYLFLEVCASACRVVAKSEEQRRGIRRLLPQSRVEVIETSIDLPKERWQRSVAAPIRIFSDCGFSFKKGTGVLIDACSALARDGIPTHLDVCGGDQPRESAYWEERRREASEIPGLSTSFPGHVALDDLLQRMLEADIYASATLGEGSSAARARALCIGIPIVTTRCGELVDAAGGGHIRLVPVADATAFRSALAQLADDLLNGSCASDTDAIGGFRSRFDRKAEWPRWIALLQEAAARA